MTPRRSALRSPRLRSHGRPEDLPVAIETTSGLVVERLLAAGHPVVPIHPNAFHAARPRWGAARAKSDPGDSAKLADYLRTDGHRLRRLQPPAPATRQLQLLVRTRDDHVAAKVAVTNQLAALLATCWPGARAIFADLASAIALDFLERYPTPTTAARLGEARLAAFLRRHSYSRRRPARASPGRAAGPTAAHRRAQPGPGPGRGRAHPGPRRLGRSGVRRGRRGPGHQSLRQEHRRLPPLGRRHPRSPSA